MEINQKLQPVQDKSYQLFTEVECQEAELEKVSTAIEQRLEGPMNDAFIQDFFEQELVAQQQVEAVRANLEVFEVELPTSE